MEPDSKLLDAKLEELHYYKQIFKYLKHIEHLYKTNKIQKANKLLYIEVSLNNCKSEIDALEKALEGFTDQKNEA